MSELGKHYLNILLESTTPDEFEFKVLNVIYEIDSRYRKKSLSKESVNEIYDEIVFGLLKAGYKKRSPALEHHGGFEEFRKSLSIDNSKSDDLMAMAYPSRKMSNPPRKP